MWRTATPGLMTILALTSGALSPASGTTASGTTTLTYEDWAGSRARRTVAVNLDAVAPSVPDDGYYLWVTGDFALPIGDGSSTSSGRVRRVGPRPCTIVPFVWNGIDFEGGVLDPRGGGQGTTVDSRGRIASMGDYLPSLTGSITGDRVIYVTQGDERQHPGRRSAQAIISGCGSGGSNSPPGGCGDPTPVGGTYGGLFGGSPYAPVINDVGDVLFVSEIDDGPAPVGLFLYRADTNDVVEIALIGDPIPGGETIGTIGSYNLNNDRAVVFLAEASSSPALQYILRWEDGQLDVAVERGSSYPGGQIDGLIRAWVGYANGISVPIEPNPELTNDGRVFFTGFFLGGPTGEGTAVFQIANGNIEPVLRTGDAGAPGAERAIYRDFWGPVARDDGDLAVLASAVDMVGSGFSVWVTGHPGAWRHVIRHGDVIEGESVDGLAISRAPQTPLGEDGALAFWAATNNTETRWTALARPGNPLVVVARTGDPGPFEGIYLHPSGWPSLSPAGIGTIGTSLIATPTTSFIGGFSGCDAVVGVGDATPAGPRDSGVRVTVQPNPVIGSARLYVDLDEPADHARVRVFDATGRWIRTLYSGALPSGHIELTWDGWSRVGPASPGAYFAVIDAGDARRSVKIQLLW